MVKPVKYVDERIVIYDQNHWNILKEKRKKAIKILQCLNMDYAILHGSVARGDVNPDSDVEIAITQPIPIYEVITKLEFHGFTIHHYELVMATPKTTPKLYIYLDEFEEQVITIPLKKLSRIEEEFYKFSGYLTLQELLKDKRVPGVNKKLLLIIPIENGHIEKSVIGNDIEVAKYLGISPDVVYERVQMLTRRDEIGRTGVFIRKKIHPNEPIEEIIMKELEKRKIKL